MSIPVVIASVACLLASLLRRFGGGVDSELLVAGGYIVSFGWWAAATTALAGCQGWQWWPEDAWRQAIWPLLAWVLLVASTAAINDAISWRWIVAGLLSIATAAVAMPGGSGWEDTLPLHRNWLSWVAASCLLNTYALERLSRVGAHRWSLLVALAGLAGPMALAAATYGSLAQWGLAMIVATAVMACVGVFAPFTSMVWVAAIPATVAGSALVAAGRFYTYEDHPTWLYAVMLFLPAVVTLMDLPLRNRNAWLRVAISGSTSAALVAACIWQTLL